MIIGRVLRGISIGMLSISAPVFLNEISRTRTKAVEIGMFQFFGVTGTFLSYWMAISMPPDKFNMKEERLYWKNIDKKYIPWRLLFLLPSAIAILQLYLLIVVFKEDPSLDINLTEDSSDSSQRAKASHRKFSPRIASVSTFNQSGSDFNIKKYKVKTKNNKVTKVLILNNPLKLQVSSKEYEYINEDITFKMLFTPKYRKGLLVGCILGLLQQLSGAYAIFNYSYYFGFIDSRFYGMRFLVATLLFIFTFTSLYLLKIAGRKPILMWGYLLTWLWNCLMFDVHDVK